MRCKCGYEFSGLDRKFESYATIHDRDYQKFLKSEARVLAAAAQTAKLKAVARSSELVGSLIECPQCSRTLLLKPGATDWVFLRREKEQRIFAMSDSELEAMPTRQLLGRLRRLQRCEESLALSDRQSADVPGCIQFKQSADWIAAYRQLRQILANREHVPKGAELAQKRRARARRAKSSERKAGKYAR